MDSGAQRAQSDPPRLSWTLRRDGNYMVVDVTGPQVTVAVGYDGISEEPEHSIILGSADVASLTNALARWLR